MIKLKSKLKNYSLDFINQIHAAKLEDYNLIIIDKKVFKLYEKIFSQLSNKKFIKINVNEEAKNFKNIHKVLDKMILNGMNRSSRILAIGGGVIQDLIGFICSIYFRGIKWDYYPTTLLSMGDSCIGGKTSINYKSYKNILGTFCPPDKIICYVPFVSTLSHADYMSGLSEILKINLVSAANYKSLPKTILSASYKDESLKNIIKKTLLIKRNIIEEDEFDTGKRNHLNFGHCVGHALESTSVFKIPHGLAVHAGMRFSVDISLRLNLIDKKNADNLLDCLDEFFIVKDVNKYLDNKKIVNIMKKDKKRIKKGLSVICPISSGGVKLVHDVAPSLVLKALRYYPKSDSC
jgi:3-dehydroquinate synthase